MEYAYDHTRIAYSFDYEHMNYYDRMPKCACTHTVMHACMHVHACLHACMHARPCMDVSHSQASIVYRPCRSCIKSKASRLFLFFLMVSGRFKPFSCSSMCYYVIRIIILISIIYVIKKVQHSNEDNKSVLPSYLPAFTQSHLPSNRPSGLLPSSCDTVPLSIRLIETFRHLGYPPPTPTVSPSQRNTVLQSNVSSHRPTVRIVNSRSAISIVDDCTTSRNRPRMHLRSLGHDRTQLLSNASSSGPTALASCPPTAVPALPRPVSQSSIVYRRYPISILHMPQGEPFLFV